MTESTARIDRLDIPATPAPFYTWQVPQKPLAVRLPLPLVDRLELETVEAFRSLTSRGSEIGGLLLGSLSHGNPMVVTVEDYELIACDYSRGPLYRLSDADMSRFERALEQHASGAGLRVAGFFRSHTRKGVTLDAEDLAFFEPRFLDPNHIVMLIRPFATKASVAGIYFRENGRIAGETSLLEFPFRSSDLSSGKKPEATIAHSAPSIEPPPAVKPPVRAQIVPIATRREIAPEPPVAAPPPPPPQAVARAAAPIVAKPPAPAVTAPEPKVVPAVIAPETKAAPPAPPSGPKGTPAEKVEKKEAKKAEPKEEKKAQPRDEKKVELKAEKKAEPEKAAAAAPATKVDAAPLSLPSLGMQEEAKSNKKLKLIVSAAVAMIVLVGGGLFVYPTLLHRGTRTVVPGQDSSSLALRLERTTGGMQLYWKKDSPAILAATKVILSISDGDRHENVEMDPNQVRTGSILYPPLTGDVSFQLEVTDAKGNKTASESLRIHDPRPSPLADATATAPAATPNGAKPTAPAAAKPADTTEVTAAADEKVEPEAVTRQVTPTRAFNKDSLAQRLRPVASTDLGEAPPVMSTSSAVGGLGALAQTPGIAPGAPPPPSAPKGGNPAAPATKAVAGGGQIVPAVVTYKKSPEYPKVARSAGAQGTVEVDAIIGIDGHVKNAHASKGNPMLQKAAVDAVMQWLYKPAMLNGTPIESPVQIRLNFVGDR